MSYNGTMERTLSSSLPVLRSELKARRRSISPFYQIQSEKRACQFLSVSLLFSHSRYVAVYIDHNNEFPTGKLLDLIQRHDKPLFLPVLEDSGEPQLRFIQYSKNSRLKKNRFGIPEPQQGTILPAKRLDLVITPLLGFDAQGNRLGMGGGYYDRTFKFLKSSRSTKRPFLLGLAFDDQQVDALDAQPWDVPLDGILTESGLHIFLRKV